MFAVDVAVLPLADHLSDLAGPLSEIPFIVGASAQSHIPKISRVPAFGWALVGIRSDPGNIEPSKQRFDSRVMPGTVTKLDRPLHAHWKLFQKH